jgi:hypothetical protein
VSEFKKIDFGLKIRDEMIIQLNQSIARLNQKEKPEGSNQQGDKKKKDKTTPYICRCLHIHKKTYSSTSLEIYWRRQIL